jgi:N-acetylglucosaminyldiphosphoundecaprenol N-acetyl-beta-D-mannosaminyltransferase
VLRGQHLALRVAGTHTPPFGFEHDPRQLELIRAGLRAARPDNVYVGLGFPKQERVIRELRGEFPGTWFLGVGASISFVAGVVPRAPRWLQRTGLEWLHRLALEPRRLGPRYLLHDLPFAVRLLAHSAASRARNRLGPPSAH